MRCPHPDLANASDGLKQISLATQVPIRGATQIWVVKHHQYVIFVLIPQMSFRRKPVALLKPIFINLLSLHTTTHKLHPWKVENNPTFFYFLIKVPTKSYLSREKFIDSSIAFYSYNNYAKSTFHNNHSLNLHIHV